ncbi:hypothetical protein PAPYR_7579 [Paratrimastix pyriformis]|uniref:Uncharacterized protein n=1 Tax=Paratrimastix pyriformis TaxID=342808 RepID=A0ABQ8UI07_9EUKA|nr:hypothetical protein PAPYR_7579 [Paratrimastix pyriformis]
MGSLPIPRALSVTHLAHQHQCSVFFFGVGLRLPMTITPTLGPLRAIRGMFGCGARGYTNTGKNWCYALEGLAPVHAPNSTPARQGCLHRFTGAGRRLVTKKPRARGREPSWDLRGKVPVAAPSCSAFFSTRAFGPRHAGQRVLSLFCFAPPFICGFSSPTCFLLTGYSGARAPPGAGRDPLEEMFGVRMVDHESLFFVFIETFGSCDSQLDCLLRCAVLTPFPPYSASVAGVSSAVLRACCASVHSFLVWAPVGLRRIRTAGQGKKDATESENHPGEYLVQLNTDGSGEMVLSQRLQKVNGDDEAGIQMIRVREPTCQQLGEDPFVKSLSA